MQNAFYDATAPKMSTDLSVNSDLVREETCRSWHKENREAIEAYNRRVQNDGTFSDDLRHF